MLYYIKIFQVCKLFFDSFARFQEIFLFFGVPDPRAGAFSVFARFSPSVARFSRIAFSGSEIFSGNPLSGLPFCRSAPHRDFLSASPYPLFPGNPLSGAGRLLFCPFIGQTSEFLYQKSARRSPVCLFWVHFFPPESRRMRLPFLLPTLFCSFFRLS